jgi:hypothetical protein
MSTSPKTLAPPSTPSPAWLLALTADDPYDDRVEDILKLSIVPNEAHEAFRSMVTSVNDFLASDESALSLLVDELSTVHKPLAKSPYKKKILLNNLLSLAEFKRAGGSVRANPTLLEQKACIDATRMTHMSTFHRNLLSASPPPDPFPATPDTKMENGSKLAQAIPPFNGEREKWFDWKEIVQIKIAQFPSFGKVFAEEAEANKDMVKSDVLYSIFQKRTIGGAAATLVQSATPKTGFHAFKALMDAMEGEETVDRIRKEAQKYKAAAKKESGKSILEYRGDCQKYFKVADRVEVIEGRTALSEERKIKHILDSIQDLEYKETMLRLKAAVDDKKWTTSEEIFSQLSKTETYLATAVFNNDDADSTPPTSIRRTQGQQSTGPTKKVQFEEGSQPQTKFSEVALPSGLYESMTPEMQVWALEWARTLRRTGDAKLAAKVSKPSDEAVEKHKKRRAGSSGGRDGGKSEDGEKLRKKKNKDGKTKKTNTNGPKSNVYPPSTSSPSDVVASPSPQGGALSIGTLAGGATSVSPRDKAFPVLRIIMFKEPKGIILPVSSSSPTHRPNGALAINSRRATNPREDDIDPKSRDYSFVESPKTILSTVSSRQVQLSRLVRSRKLIVDSVPGQHDGMAPDVVSLTEMARENATLFQPTTTTETSTRPTVTLQVRRTTGLAPLRPTRTLLDTCCDWSVVAVNWKVVHEYDELFRCRGAFSDGDEVPCRLVDAVTIFVFSDVSLHPILVRANRVLYLDDPGQYESLLDPVQLWANGIFLDLCAARFKQVSGENGRQGMSVA